MARKIDYKTPKQLENSILISIHAIDLLHLRVLPPIFNFCFIIDTPVWSHLYRYFGDTTLNVLTFKIARGNRTEKISSIQIFRRESIPLLGRGNFKFDVPIEIETSITIISPLVEHPVSYFKTYILNHVTCLSRDMLHANRIQAARFCHGGRQKINDEWTTYTRSEFEDCKNGTVISDQISCKNKFYAIKEEKLKRVSICENLSSQMTF